MLSGEMMVGSILTRKALAVNGGNKWNTSKKKSRRRFKSCPSHISWSFRLRVDMRAKNAATLAYSHEQRNPCSSLRLRAEVMRICQYQRLATFLIHQTNKRKPTPSDNNCNGGICPHYTAECGKVPNMVVVCNHNQNSGITKLWASKKNEKRSKEQTYI